MAEMKNEILSKLPWEHLDEICFLLLGYAVGFGLIALGQKEVGNRVIDGTFGAMLMWMKGK